MTLHADLLVRRGEMTVRARLDVADGETLALLGPNGAGKSTVVDALAGIVPAEGEVVVDGRSIEGAAPEDRSIGVAFQDGLLFPNLSAAENVAFPLRARGATARKARARAGDLLRQLAPGVDPAARPSRLSGGERQRVSLARALAPEPRLLLLDEPLAAVDVSARGELREVLRAIVEDFAGACILVAHDPIDALTLSDRVAILEEGSITQTGTPEDIRRAPRTPYGANLVGVNLFRGRLEPESGGVGRLVTAEGQIVVAWPAHHTQAAEATAIVRPSDVALHLRRPEGSPRNVLEGEIAEVAVQGDRARVRVRSAPPLVAELTQGSLERLGLAAGIRVFASFKAVEVRLVEYGPEPGTLDR